MKSLVAKRSVMIAGHKTSVSLEEAFWIGLKEIATKREITLSELVGSIDLARVQDNLSSAIRLFVLEHYRGLIETSVGSPRLDTGLRAAAKLSSAPLSR